MSQNANSSPLISIITVCYNEADRIIETCESIVNQSFQNFEWIVLDGGSTDGTLEVLSRYRNRMAYYRSAPDGGIYAAMNEGTKHARGEFCLFLNGGDSLFRDTALEALVPYLDKGKDVVVTDVWFPEIGISPYFPDDVNLLSLVVFGLPHPSTLIRRSLIQNHGCYDETFKIAADLDLFFRLRNAGAHFGRIPCITSAFHLDGISNVNTERSQQEAVTVYRKNVPSWKLCIYTLFKNRPGRYLLRRGNQILSSFPGRKR